MVDVPDAGSPHLRHGAIEREPGWVEWLAIPLLLVGGIGLMAVSAQFGTGTLVLPGVGWLCGVLLLWLSKIWTVRDKLLGTLVLPGGLLGAAYLTLSSVSVERCTTGPGIQHCTGGISTGARVALIALWVVLVAAPIATSFQLARRLRAT